jgi:hypothetical protein
MDRLAEARQRVLVGRQAERALFDAALSATALPFSVIALHGPGGVGKTTLVREFAGMCRAAGVPVAFIDTRSVEPTPEAFLRALDAALPGFRETAETSNERRALILDTYETIEALDGWLRDVFLPRLSEQTLIVLAGRFPLPVTWLSDPGWQPLLRSIALRNLSPDDSRSYLSQRAVPAVLHDEALSFTHGHPLALSLIADVLTRPGGDGVTPPHFSPEHAPNVVHALLERFMESVPDARHRAALEVCALVRSIDESFLASVLDEPEPDENGGDSDAVHQLFEWLRGLSFIEAGANGLFPHDSAREALLADLRWRNRDRYVELHRRAREFYALRLKNAQGQNQQRLLYDAIFLHRDSAVIRTAFTWQESPSAYPDSPRPSDADSIQRMVTQYEGEESARIAADWLRREPDAAVVFRDLAEPDGDPVGFFILLTLPADSNPDAEPDPAAAQALRYLQKAAPLRPGEVARYLRYWMARDSYQNPSPVQSLVIVHALRQFLLRSRLAFTFFACADPEIWAPVFDYVDIDPLPAAAFTIGERTYGVYGKDWRTMPAAAWLARLFDREVADGALSDAAPEPTKAPLIVLSEPEFAASVRDALRGFYRPDGLQHNPLMRSSLILSRAGDDADAAAQAEALRAAIIESADALKASPRDARGYRALFHTYIQPAPTQEQAADLLDLPFNTYRRHLGEGIAAVTTRLWQLEIGAG